MPYLDQASTSYPKPPEVPIFIQEYLTHCGVSPGRGNHYLAVKADQLVEKTRKDLAKLLNIQRAENLIFTHNATHSLNLILKGFLRPQDHVLLCQYSHNAALRPLEALKQRGISYDIVPIDEEGNVDLHQLQSKCNARTRLLIATEASNVIGTLADFQEAFSLCRSRSIAILIDTTQSLGYTQLRESVDFLVGTGHKTLLGPSGVGFAYIQDPSQVTPFCEGGSPGNSSLAAVHPEKMPYKFEAGTPNSVSIAGLCGALQYIRKIGFSAIAGHALNLTDKLIKGLLALPQITLYGSRDLVKKVPILSLNVKGWLPSQVAHELDQRYQICVRAGLHCAPLIHRKLGTAPTGTVRVSLGHQNSEEEVDLLLQALSTY